MVFVNFFFELEGNVVFGFVWLNVFIFEFEGLLLVWLGIFSFLFIFWVVNMGFIDDFFKYGFIFDLG